ncbi:hypothetical protein AX16_010331 [Volvariella volvacea WC 439]|nr:hypothetical protein AX16_010331 [Volvariella volvacea WC 439]
MSEDRSRNSLSAGFTTIGDGIYLKKGSTRVEKGEPRLILMFGWIGAQLPHLHKYTAEYEKIFPNSTMALATFTNLRKLEPVLRVLEAAGCSPTNSGDLSSVLIHVFSNASNLTTSTRSSRWSTSQFCLSHSAIVLDSCPGDGGISAHKRAYGALVPNLVLRQLLFVIMNISDTFLH